MFFLRHLCLGLFLSAAVLGSAHAATLREALDQAWSVQTDQLLARDQQYAAQVNASDAWTPAPPTVGLFNTTDQFNDDNGRNEWEVGIATPIWLPGQRDRGKAVANTQMAAFNGQSQLMRWQLAGQLRESWWVLRFAQADLANADRQLEEAQVLANDVAARVKSGDLAALDQTQAKIGIEQARRQQYKAKRAVQRSRETFALISNGASVPDQNEPLGEPPAIDQHPMISSLQASIASAQARLEQATGDTRDAPEVGLTYTSERDQTAQPYEDRVKLGITIPLGSASRNQPRIKAANADWIEAQTTQQVERRRINAEIKAATLELEQSIQLQGLAAEELKLVNERAAWITKGFRLGQFDLMTQIRSEQEQLAAQAQVERAALEYGQAISRLNQAAGVLP